MNANPGTLVTLAWHFTIMSLLAVGGAYAALPEMYRLSVEVMGWMTDRQFNEMFAIAQLSPGPNVIVVTLIGYQAAGIAGALVATLAMCGPTCVLAFYITRVWDRFRGATLQIVIQAALVPLSLGLIAASALLVTRAADTSIVLLAITAATAAMTYWTKFNPLWIFAVAALMAAVGVA